MRVIQTSGSALAAALVVSVLGAGCGSGLQARARPASIETPRQLPARERAAPGQARAASVVAHSLALDQARTRPFGRGVRYRPPSLGDAVRARLPVAGLRCGLQGGSWYGAHVELFAEGREIAVPAGIGIAPPQLRLAGSVSAGACEYPLRTADPTGVVLVSSAHTGPVRPTLGALFALWGQPLNSQRLAGFTARPGSRVTVFVDGRRVGGDPRSIDLRPHAQIVVEVGPYVEPHPAYRFAPGV